MKSDTLLIRGESVMSLEANRDGLLLERVKSGFVVDSSNDHILA